MTEITLSTGHPVPLKPAPVKKFRGTRLPGAELLYAEEAGLNVSIHNYSQKLFRYSLRSLHCHIGQAFTIKELSKYLRLETVLTGELRIREQTGKEWVMVAGQYRITDSKLFQCRIEAGQGCQYFVVFFSPELLAQTPLSETVMPGGPIMMTKPMREVFQKITDNPFEDKVRDAFYDYSIRELLFYHISAPVLTVPGELTTTELSAVYAADKIIASNLSIHYSIQELAKMTRTNVHVLKTGFSRVFGMGSFERLLHRKMERAKYLLETTDRQVQDISELAGYETVTGFINAFRKQFKMTPKDWRKKSRRLL